MRRFGFAHTTGVPLPGESPGIVLNVKDYSGSSMGNLPIGQGIAVTPIQMARAYSAIANGGRLVQAAARDGRQGRAPRGPRMISRRTAHGSQSMLEGVLGPTGTAPEAAVAGYDIAGKTGTAEKAEAGGYSESKFVASFIGFAPARNARLLVAVIVDEPGGPTPEARSPRRRSSGSPASRCRISASRQVSGSIEPSSAVPRT